MRIKQTWTVLPKSTIKICGLADQIYRVIFGQMEMKITSKTDTQSPPFWVIDLNDLVRCPPCSGVKGTSVQKLTRCNSCFFADECHLLWGDVCEYIWGRTDIRIEILILNQKNKQTYYRALNYQNKESIVKQYSAGNGENTVSFMTHLGLL